ncbi:hypothetical protein DSO57_1004416 [Entomophthora muscae]|uniref:Uncharacterized protein n=1 Tax=Entomophthora muscae TaxID=34485 RepID=A0ACC2TIW9_9FUNG|nr:hypothetical protein DSO57_1004416 [Entomophthora muscae]
MSAPEPLSRDSDKSFKIQAQRKFRFKMILDLWHQKLCTASWASQHGIRLPGKFVGMARYSISANSIRYKVDPPSMYQGPVGGTIEPIRPVRVM